MAAAGVSHLRSLLRELRFLDSRHGSVAPSLLNPQTLRAVLGSAVDHGDQVFRNSILYHPQPQPSAMHGAAVHSSREVPVLTNFRLRARSHLRRPSATMDSAAVVAATVSVCCASATQPLPRCDKWNSRAETSQKPGLEAVELVLRSTDVKAGDLIVAHPGLTQEGLGGCVGVVLRHSPEDTLCMILNVDSGINENAAWQSPLQRRRPPWRLHVHLPPIAQEDPRHRLPTALHKVPLRWGGPFPTPLHLLHTVPLTTPTRKNGTFERLTGHEVYPGLWCSFVDDHVLKAVDEKVQSGEAQPSNFGAFVGMMCLEPDRLENYMIQNHWFIVRPRGDWQPPPEGWGGFAWTPDGQWIDDRQWAPWRTIMDHLGGEFAEWAAVDWRTGLPGLFQNGQGPRQQPSPVSRRWPAEPAEPLSASDLLMMGGPEEGH